MKPRMKLTLASNIMREVYLKLRQLVSDWYDEALIMIIVAISVVAIISLIGDYHELLVELGQYTIMFLCVMAAMVILSKKKK